MLSCTRVARSTPTRTKPISQRILPIQRPKIRCQATLATQQYRPDNIATASAPFPPLPETSRALPEHPASHHEYDYIRYPLSQGRIGRIALKPPKIYGAAVSRGMRSYQEDTHTVASIYVPPKELALNCQRHFGINWEPEHIGDTLAGQLTFAGVYDGHGGPAISGYLQRELHKLMESMEPSHVPRLVESLKNVGGYFKRFKGGALEDWVVPHDPPRTFDLEARATLAFLAADKKISTFGEAQKSGATGSVALLHSLQHSAPFFASEDLALTVAHCGDTRVILCATDTGRAYPMTENHHPNTRGEQARLRRMGHGLVLDAFGEARFMGTLANTRGFGDSRYKYFGVTPEPEIRTRRLTGKDWAFMALFSDGISNTLSDDEIVDLARNTVDPQHAARKIMGFAEELGVDDNATFVILPLAGWGRVKGKDKTLEMREWKRQQAEESAKGRRR